MRNVQKQQGDVNMWSVPAIPEDAEPLETNIVEEGEATGHMHEVVGSEFQLFGHDGKVLADVRSDDCKIIHPEHNEIDLEPGVWEFGPTYEYNYEEEERRVVQD